MFLFYALPIGLLLGFALGGRASGMALRFARVLRHRPDKSAAEADTVDTVRAIHQGVGPIG